MTILIILAFLFALLLTACGNKGKLKSPSQIEAAEAKQAQKDAKKNAKEADEEGPNSTPPTDIPPSEEGSQ